MGKGTRDAVKDKTGKRGKQSYSMRASGARKGRKSSGKMRALARREMRGSALCGRSGESAEEDEYMKSGRAGV